MLTMNEDLASALRAYILCIENKDYFDAHEVLEEAWHPLRLRKDPLRNLLKGYINAAICFEHIKRDRKNSRDKAQRVLVSYTRYSDLCKEGIPHEGLFFEAKTLIESLRIQHAL